MRDGWQQKKLIDTCLKITDGSHYSPKTSDAGFPYITVRDIKNENGLIDFENCKFITKSDYEDLVKNGCKPVLGDILFSKDGTVGKVSLVNYDKEFVVLSSLAIIRPNSELIESTYLRYILRAPFFIREAVGKKTGAAIRRIVLRNLKTIIIPFPSLVEQKRIVAILDEAFAGIDAAIANTKKNLANARELFESYLNAVFTQRSEGWAEKKLSTLIDISHGYAFKGSDFGVSTDASKFIVLTPGNYTEDGKLFFSEKNTKRFSGELLDAYLFDEGDLTIVMTDLSSKMKILGKPAFIESPNILHNQRIGRVMFKNVAVIPRFLYFYLRTGLVTEQIKQTSTGTMVRHTAPNRILVLNIAFPVDKKQQSEIVASLDALSIETQQLEVIYQQKLHSLSELKQSLLQKAFSGELTAADEPRKKAAVV